MLHMLVGIIAMGISRFIFDPNRDREQMDAIPEVVLTTLLTGIGLILPSFIMGLIFLMVLRIRVFDQNPIQPGIASEGFSPTVEPTT